MSSVSASQYDRYEVEILQVIKEGAFFLSKHVNVKMMSVTQCCLWNVTLNNVSVCAQAPSSV